MTLAEIAAALKQRGGQSLASIADTFNEAGRNASQYAVEDPRSWGDIGDQALDAVMRFFPLHTAYHGSPHLFDKFDMSKIGTGEGAQAYGHGLYFADNPGVARAYQEQVKDMAMIDANNKRMSELARAMEKDSPGGYRQFRTDAGRQAAAEYDKLMAEKMRPGNLYKVDIPDEAVANMLHWDKPLSEQPANVRYAAKDMGLPKDATGKDLYQAFTMQARDAAIARGQNAQTTLQAAQAAAAKDLRDFGIPGIRYLDQGSRGAKEGTYNTVLFDDTLPKILSRE